MTSGSDTLLFVYGTLRHDAIPSNSGIVSRCGGTLEATGCTVRGRLHNFGWFPGLVLDDAGNRVAGELWRVPAANMGPLDRYEGPTYRRESVVVRTTDGSELSAEVFTVRDDFDLTHYPTISSGNWVQA